MKSASKHISYEGVSLHYGDRGSGTCMVLLHGYLEDMRIWERFLEYLPESLRIICPDLPGHGKSGVWGEEHGMDELAMSVRAILRHEGINFAFIVGHSMGGYVSLAFTELFPEVTLGCVLFHSSCFADTPEKKQNREREISLIRCGKKQQIVSVNIPKAFADDHLSNFSEEVKMAREIALSCSDDGIVALLKGMMSRPDRCRVFSDPTRSFLLIGGMKDNYIGQEVYQKLCHLAPHITFCRLEESGHMGFIEEPVSSAEALLTYFKKETGEELG